MDNILSYNEKNNILNLLKRYTNDEYEFEIRLGYFQDYFFKSDMELSKYNKLLNMDELYNLDAELLEMTLVCKSINNNQKNISYKDYLPGKTTYRRKNRVNTINLNLLETRLALSHEIDLKSSTDIFDHCFRFKDRISRISKNGKWRYDFTKVYDLNIKNENIKDIKKVLSISNYHYEIEIEYIDKLDTINLEQIIEILYMLKKNGYNNHKHILKDIQNLFSNKIEFNRYIKKVPSHMLNFKKITNHLITLNHKNINNILENYSISEKADGENNFIFISDEGYFLINDRSKITKLDYKLKDKSLINTLINGEYVNYLKAFYSFDILIYKGQEITLEPFSKRISYLEDIKKGTIDSDRLRLYNKQFYHGNIFKNADKIYNKTKFPYNIDGLVFIGTHSKYRSVIYKWKPLDEVTTDFLVKQSPIKDTFYLYVTINKDDLQKYNMRVDDDHDKLFPMFQKNAFYVPIKFQMPNIKKKTYLVKDKTLKDNTVVEFSYNNKWCSTRLRIDKTEKYQQSMRLKKFFGPNAFGVAYDNWTSLHENPITLNIITGKEPIPSDNKLQRYFVGKSRKNSNIVMMNVFHSIVVKYMLYLEYIGKARNNKNVLELSCGRGGDIHKWIKNKIKYLTIQDFDQIALDVAKKRLNTSKHNIKVKYIQSDLREDVYNTFGTYKFNAISMHFAIHYMLGNQTTLKNVLKTIKYNLVSGGYFIFTALDGQLVFDLLAKNSVQYNETYEFKKNNKKVFGITRLYKENTFEQLGQEISVYVETIGDHPGEFLVNYDYLLNNFEKNGLKLVKSDYFKNILDTWENKSKMSDAEIQYSSLNRYMIVRKV